MGLRASLQAQADADPSDSRHDEIDTEEKPENVPARRRPVCRDLRGREGARSRWKGAPRSRVCPPQGEERRSKKRILECHKASNDVQRTEKEPEEESAPRFHSECIDDLGHRPLSAS